MLSSASVGAAAGRRDDGDDRESRFAAASAAGAVRAHDGVHVVVHVEEPWQAPRMPGFAGRFAERELRLTPTKWPLINKTQATCAPPVGVARIAARAVRARAWREGSDDAGR